MTRALVDHTPLPVDAIDLVNEAASASPPVTLLGRDGASSVPPGSAALEGILAMVARDTIELFTGSYRQRVRACLGHDCSLFFVDRSRPGSRRWCTMAACGEKASSATYRRRHPAHPKLAHR
jgi:predicted RNA-binding Zn ribbon-like protein